VLVQLLLVRLMLVRLMLVRLMQRERLALLARIGLLVVLSVLLVQLVWAMLT
jgi:hypothetical protein